MITRNDSKDKALIKDKLKRIMLYLVVGAVLVVTGSLVYNSSKVLTNGQAQTTKKEKEVLVVTKEDENVVGGKLVKTKQTTTTQNPEKKPSGFQEYAIELLGEKTMEAVVFKHFLAYLTIAILHLLFRASLKGGYIVKIPWLEVSKDKVETEQIAKKLEDQSIKLEMLAYWVNDVNKEAFSQTVPEPERTFLGFMTAMLENIQGTYSSEWNTNFSFAIYTMQEFQDSSLPSIVKKSAVALDESKIGLSIDKENDLPYDKNYWIYKVEEVDVTDASNVTEYMIVLSSYYSSFGKADETVFAGVCSVAKSVHNEAAKGDLIIDLVEMCEDLIERNDDLNLQIQRNQTQ